jgi:hypothetical protein
MGYPYPRPKKISLRFCTNPQELSWRQVGGSNPPNPPWPRHCAQIHPAEMTLKSYEFVHLKAALILRLAVKCTVVKMFIFSF